MTKKMSPKDRELALINGEDLDMMPIWQMNGIVAAQSQGHLWKDIRFDAKKCNQIAIEFGKKAGTDTFGFTCVELNVIVADLPGVELKFSDDNYANVMSHYYNEPEDVDKKALYDPTDPKKAPWLWKGLLGKTTLMAKEVKDFLPIQVTWGVMSTAGFMRNVEALLMDMALEPELAHKVFVKAEELVDGVQRVGLDAGCRIANFGDPTASGSLINGDTYKEFCTKHVTKLVKNYRKEYKVPFYMHVCGETAPVAKEICATGVDLFSVDFMNNLTEIRGLIGDKVILAGNLNPMDVIWKGTPETVMAASKKIIDEVKGTRFVLATGCETPRDTPLENLQAMKKAVEKYAVY